MLSVSPSLKSLTPYFPEKRQPWRQQTAAR